MSEEHFFLESPVAQLIIEPYRNQIVAANEEACSLLNRELSDIVHSHVSEVFSGCFERLIVFTDELIHKGRGWSDRLTIQDGSNETRLEAMGKSIFENGELVLHLCFHKMDEVDHFRSRSEAHHHFHSGLQHWNKVAGFFKEFERQNHLLLDAAGEGIYGVDADGLTSFVNPAAEKILGYTAKELAGKNMHTMVHHSHADGSHYDAEECPIFAAFRDGIVHRVEDDIFWSKSGKAIHVEYTSTPILENGVLMGAVIIFRDITQKKDSQQQLLSALKEVKELKDRLELENAYLLEEINADFNHRHIIGKSAPIQSVLRQISLVAPTEATVLIHGESGTGKELIARAIHDESDRSRRSLIRVNCAAIPEDLFESEFFGHVKGAFTGAVSNRAGRFQLADGGTLFLDEVGEIPLHLQGKLLRVIQEMQFEPVGDASTIHVDVRIIAATNRDLKKLVEQGKFREDLYFRLNVFPINSIPLRQRKEDIPLLTQYFLERVSKSSGKTGLIVSKAEMQRLAEYDWPGNIRELENVIERQVILARGDSIRFENLDTAAAEVMPVNKSNENDVLTHTEMKAAEKQNIILALERCAGKVFGEGGAAELLAMKPTTLSSQMKKLQIDAREYKGA